MSLRSIWTRISTFAAAAVCAGALTVAVATTADAQGNRGFGGGGFGGGRAAAAPRGFSGGGFNAGPRFAAGPRLYQGGRIAPAWRTGGRPWRHHHRRWRGGYGYGWGWGAVPLLGLGAAYYDPYPVYGYPAYARYDRCVMRKRWVKRHHRWVKRWVRVCYR